MISRFRHENGFIGFWLHHGPERTNRVSILHQMTVNAFGIT
jgi:hypothetical protein